MTLLSLAEPIGRSLNIIERGAHAGQNQPGGSVRLPLGWADIGPRCCRS
jgi:hypothetical protein